MPPDAKRLEEEGVVLRHELLVRDGRFLEEEIVRLLESGPYPARNLPERLSDLRSQVAAVAKGGQLLQAIHRTLRYAGGDPRIREVPAGGREGRG